MRRAKKEDITKITDLLVERFYDLEMFTFVSNGMENPRETLKILTQGEVEMFFSRGEVYVNDEITCALSGLPSDKFGIFVQLMGSLRTLRRLKYVSEKDRSIVLERNKSMSKIYSAKKWYRKYTKNSYYIAQAAVSKELKGTGTFRELIMPVLEDCRHKHMDVVLETATFSNVAIYEHFGFKLMETHSSPEIPFAIYCLLKRWDQ